MKLTNLLLGACFVACIILIVLSVFGESQDCNCPELDTPVGVVTQDG